MSLDLSPSTLKRSSSKRVPDLSKSGGTAGKCSAPTTTIFRGLVANASESLMMVMPRIGYSRMGSTKTMKSVRRSRTWSRISRLNMIQTFDQCMLSALDPIDVWRLSA